MFDSDKILQMDYTVKKIIIYGAGVIGCEYASIFTGLGYKVDLINNQDQLLNYLDSQILSKVTVIGNVHYWQSLSIFQPMIF